jgi:hypothetical protein
MCEALHQLLRCSIWSKEVPLNYCCIWCVERFDWWIFDGRERYSGEKHKSIMQYTGLVECNITFKRLYGLMRVSITQMSESLVEELRVILILRYMSAREFVFICLLIFDLYRKEHLENDKQQTRSCDSILVILWKLMSAWRQWETSGDWISLLAQQQLKKLKWR